MVVEYSHISDRWFSRILFYPLARALAKSWDISAAWGIFGNNVIHYILLLYMLIGRRILMQHIGGAAIAASLPLNQLIGQDMEEVFPYGIIAQINVKAGKRDALIEILANGTRKMPGNISYVISEDQADGNAIWITEYWLSKEDHTASLQLPAVQEAIGKGREFIEGFGHRFEVTPKAG